MDQYVCGLGGLRYVDCATEPPRTMEALPWPNDATVVLGDTGLRRTARSVIDVPDSDARQALLQAQYAARAAAAVERLRQLDRVPTLDVRSVGYLLGEAHAWLNRYLARSNPTIEACVAAALEVGAFGAKIAGRGGHIFALVDRNDVDAVAAAIQRAGGRARKVQVGGPGVMLHGAGGTGGGALGPLLPFADWAGFI